MTNSYNDEKQLTQTQVDAKYDKVYTIKYNNDSKGNFIEEDKDGEYA